MPKYPLILRDPFSQWGEAVVSHPEDMALSQYHLIFSSQLRRMGNMLRYDDSVEGKGLFIH